MKILAIMLKDLRLISRDRFALASLLVVPMVVILVVASATQSGDGSESILFPIVNEDQGPVASALIKVFRKHLDVREVTRATAERLVADENNAPAALILPAEMSKRYLTQKPSTIELLTDPAEWRELEAIKVIMLLADRETASLGDPFSQELLKVQEAWATAAFLLSRSAWNGRGSILNSKSPSWTIVPSRKGASSISPLTRALTMTVLGDERYPLY